MSPNTLRSWERRFGYPRPRRTAGGHRQYDLTELEALRRAITETHNISSAIEVARRRGEGPSSPSRLLDAFDRFDEKLADRVLEESLAIRSVERTVEDVLLPALALVDERAGRDAERELARRWASGWLHAQRRVCAPSSRGGAVVVFDASGPLVHEALQVQALELGLRRAGFDTVVLSFELLPERAGRAVRALQPTAFVVAGPGAAGEPLARLAFGLRRTGSNAPVFVYRGPMRGGQSLPPLGSTPVEAAGRLKGWLDTGRVEAPVKQGRRQAAPHPLHLAARL